jgi:hypothetical protein
MAIQSEANETLQLSREEDQKRLKPQEMGGYTRPIAAGADNKNKNLVLIS